MAPGDFVGLNVCLGVQGSLGVTVWEVRNSLEVFRGRHRVLKTHTRTVGRRRVIPKNLGTLDRGLTVFLTPWVTTAGDIGGDSYGGREPLAVR